MSGATLERNARIYVAGHRGLVGQFGTQYLAAMPTNLYGSGDNYHPQNSHVIRGPAG